MWFVIFKTLNYSLSRMLELRPQKYQMISWSCACWSLPNICWGLSMCWNWWYGNTQEGYGPSLPDLPNKMEIHKSTQNFHMASSVPWWRKWQYWVHAGKEFLTLLFPASTFHQPSWVLTECSGLPPGTVLTVLNYLLGLRTIWSA